MNLNTIRVNAPAEYNLDYYRFPRRLEAPLSILSRRQERLRRALPLALTAFTLLAAVIALALKVQA